MDKAYIYHKTTLQSWLIFKDIPGIIFQSCNLDMSSFAYIDKNWNFNINGSYNWFSSVLPGMQNGTRQSTSHWFAIYFHTLWFSLVLTACNLFQLWCFFYIYIFDKRATSTVRTRWFYFWSAANDLICKYAGLRGLLFEAKTLSSHMSFNSKRFEAFDHSKMPVVFMLSDILKMDVFKESSTLENLYCSSVCDVQWVIL